MGISMVWRRCDATAVIASAKVERVNTLKLCCLPATLYSVNSGSGIGQTADEGVF
jgi:hypothetical protein